MTTHFEKNNDYTPTYPEIIEFYKSVAQNSTFISFSAFGTTDSGFPLHEIVLSKHGFDPKHIKSINLPVLMINNGIHPGEPCGIDASMMLVRNILQKANQDSLLDKMVIVIIPVYNIGGCLNRSSTSRANQNGPEAYGFRGNAKNYDLNRDFIKADAANTRSFYTVFKKWDPDIFVDTHTSNGADYQYTMTLIATQSDKAGPVGGKFLEEDILPYLYKKMDEKQYTMIPYVYAHKKGIPDHGIRSFLDYPRYSSGFAALHHSWSFMPEAHMLKPYKDRVYSTLAFLETVADFISKNPQKIKLVRSLWKKESRDQKLFPLHYILDETKSDSIFFNGFEASYKPSLITGKDRLYYDRNKPYTKNIPFYTYYTPTSFVTKPKAYIIPQGYQEIIERLQENGVVVTRMENNTVLKVEKYRITDYKTSKTPYEGRFPHSEVKTESFTTEQAFFAGDFIVETDQENVRFIIETLEPQAPDSYFTWNFFDAVLMQKEYFSAYVFEDLAVEILAKTPELKQKLEDKKSKEPAFADDAYAQLEFIYKNSPYYEPSHRVYPIARWNP
ncbi:MAG: M14 family metallopeptidase [Saprospiraceae bacterium]|nr:M14 family metallopeptidase [Saprospiraceae bacterium]